MKMLVAGGKKEEKSTNIIPMHLCGILCFIY